MVAKTKKTTPVKAKSKPTTRARKSTKEVTGPSYEAIAERAWCIWMEKGCQPGQDEQNWLEAVAQLNSELVSC